MEGPLNIERDVVKNGVRLDCVFEGYEYRPERRSPKPAACRVWMCGDRRKHRAFFGTGHGLLPGTGPAGNGELPVTATGWVGGTALSSVRTDSRAEREQWSETVLFSSLPGGILQAA